MKTILGSTAFIILLAIFKVNIVFSQIELNKDLRELATETSNCKDTLNLTEIDIYSLPKIETSIVANNDLIKLNLNEKYSVKDIEEANCTLICYHEWKG